MADLIDRQAAIDAICKNGTNLERDKCYVISIATAKQRAVDIICDLPSAQPERKTGKWKIKTINTFEMAYGSTGYEPVYECSVCGRVEESYLRFDEPIMPEDADFPNYCPNCGAEMRGEQDG